jgi:hypothetical protein
VQLALHHPDLLTFEEQQLWKAVISSELLRPAYPLEERWSTELVKLHVLPVLRDLWPELMRVRSSPSELREWVDRVRTDVASGKIYPQTELEIPF